MSRTSSRGHNNSKVKVRVKGRVRVRVKGRYGMVGEYSNVATYLPG